MPETMTCTIETKPQVWDLGGTMQVTVGRPGGESEDLTVHEGEELKITATVTLTGRIRHYLCDTWLCVCLAYESCGSGPEGELCEWIELEGEYDPCRTDTFPFTFTLPGGKLTSGECGREYQLCLTLGSKDCCKKVGFIFGSCRGITLTVLPAVDTTPTAG